MRIRQETIAEERCRSPETEQAVFVTCSFGEKFFINN